MVGTGVDPVTFRFSGASISAGQGMRIDYRAAGARPDHRATSVTVEAAVDIVMPADRFVLDYSIDLS